MNIQELIANKQPGEKCDAAYARLIPQEQPGEFRGRMMTGRLTEEEQKATTGMTPESAFAKLWPDYVSLNVWRDLWKPADPQQAQMDELITEYSDVEDDD